jgi:hypothetical protein
MARSLRKVGVSCDDTRDAEGGGGVFCKRQARARRIRPMGHLRYFIPTTPAINFQGERLFCLSISTTCDTSIHTRTSHSSGTGVTGEWGRRRIMFAAPRTRTGRCHLLRVAFLKRSATFCTYSYYPTRDGLECCSKHWCVYYSLSLTVVSGALRLAICCFNAMFPPASPPRNCIRISTHYVYSKDIYRLEKDYMEGRDGHGKDPPKLHIE